MVGSDTEIIGGSCLRRPIKSLYEFAIPDIYMGCVCELDHGFPLVDAIIEVCFKKS